MTPRTFLLRGLLAGLIAGCATFVVAYTIGEAHINAAIALESPGAADPSTVISRQNQSTWGLATGALMLGAALGGVTGLASAFASGRLGRLRPSQSTALIALIGFVAIGLVPFLKYPATPPAVGNPDTLTSRTMDYFSMQAVSVLAAIAAVILARRLLSRLGTYRTVVVAGGAYLVAVVVAGQLLPTVNELGNFPADTLWYFRRASLLTLVTLWGVIGVVLTGLIGRAYDQESTTRARRDLAASL